MRMPDGPRSRAVLIVTGTYSSPKLPDLPAVYRNIEDLTEVVIGAAGMALPAANCVSLVDAASPSSAMSALHAAAGIAEDLLLVYYAGHGVLDDRGRLLLGLTQTPTPPVPWDALDVSAIREIMAESRAENRVLILDCCFSGRAIEAMGGSIADMAAAQVEVRGTYTLTSTSENTPAYAPESERHTAFTGALLELLGRGSSAAPDLLTLDYIYEDLVRSLRARNAPEPRRKGTDSAGRLALVRNPACAEAEPSVPPAPVDERFRKLSEHHAYPMIRRLVSRYIKDCVPDALESERERWNITALPATGKIKGQRRLLTLNCGPQEVLYIRELTSRNGVSRLTVVCNVAIPAGRGAGSLNFVRKRVTGYVIKYQRSVWAWEFDLIGDLADLGGPIPIAEFKNLAERLNRELMDSKSPYARYHNADLADDLLAGMRSSSPTINQAHRDVTVEVPAVSEGYGKDHR